MKRLQTSFWPNKPRSIGEILGGKQFLLDENIPLQVGHELGQIGHKVFFVGDIMPGCDDVEVAMFASENHMCLLTEDKDYGDLVFRRGLIVKSGLVLNRGGADVVAAKLQWLHIRGKLDMNFAVLRNKSAKFRPMPGTQMRVLSVRREVLSFPAGMCG